MFLNADELIELTGYRRPSKQVEWLRSYAIRVFVDRTGHPRVLRSDLESSGYQRRTTPDLDALRDLE